MNPKDKKIYLLIRTLTFPFALLPISWIHALGKLCGLIGYYCMTRYRKRALSNLALAKDLALTKAQIFRLAKQSFQNLAITCLEYPKLSFTQDISRFVHCENPEVANALYAKGQGMIFFCGHQSNWEVLFLDGNSRMKGVAIGKPIKNRRLYKWIISIREKNGGKIIAPQNAVRESIRALKRGLFVGIVGDQGMPGSGYSFPFFGRRAWSSTAPALLAYKTNSPILCATTYRVKGGYRIRYSDPIWPDLSRPIETEVIRMMDLSLTLLQESIQRSLGEWLWQHNRWKQQTLHILTKRFRQDCLCVILPDKEKDFYALLPHLGTLKQIYPQAFLSLLVPSCYRHIPLIEADDTIYYDHPQQTLLPDLRFKLVFNFTDNPQIKKHYERLSAFEVVDFKALQRVAQSDLPDPFTYSDLFIRALCRHGSIWNRD